MTDTFTLRSPDVGLSGTGTLALRTAKFGEGYTQDAGDGPNNESQKWPLRWSLNGTDAAALMSFIRAHAQGQTFFWTPPLGTQGYYTVTGYGITQVAPDVYTITSTWDQRFKP